MRKTILFISTCLLFIGVFRLLAPAISTQLMALDAVVAWLAIGVALLALANGWRWFIIFDLRFIFRALGLTLLLATLYGIDSPTFGSLRQTYVPVADLFVALESGIVMLLLAAERSSEALSPFVYLSLILTYLYRRVAARLAPGASYSRRKPI